MSKAILYTIARRKSWMKGEFMTGCTVCITKRTETHVTGYFQGHEGASFTVKHDGKSFSQGSGSSKMRFYFEDNSKHIKV